MGDLKTPFNDPGYANTTDLGGAGVTSRGSDPNADGGDGPGGLKPLWGDAPVTKSDGAESANSVSGLPSLPNRFEPNEGGVDLPSLDRPSPGTIDKR